MLFEIIFMKQLFIILYHYNLSIILFYFVLTSASRTAITIIKGFEFTW